MNFINFLSLLVIASSSCLAQTVTDVDENSIYNTQVKKFTSSIIDDELILYISLPKSYDETGKSYPVLYVLDGDITFGMAVSIARYLQFGGNIPELIVVGIGYGVLRKDAGNMRQRDFTPTEKKGKENITGGAFNFLNFLSKELFPFINSSYNTNENINTVFGYSMAGLFAFYTLFNQPETFNNYIIGSPYLLWDNEVIFSEEERAAIKFTELNATIFISVGSEESAEKYFNPIDEMVSVLEERNYKGLALHTKVFDGATHLSSPPEVITYGLLSVFRK